MAWLVRVDGKRVVLWQQIIAHHTSEMSAFTKALTRDRVSQKAIKSGDFEKLKEQLNTTHNLFSNSSVETGGLIIKIEEI
jgi:hypothetical protein